MKGLDALVLGAPKDKPSEPAEEEMQEGPDAMRDLGEALADKDWSAAWAAFQTAVSCCSDASDEDDTSEE